MKKKAFCLILTEVLLLSGCSLPSKTCDLSDYVKTMEYHDGFTILTLSDIHWSTGTDQYSSEAYMNKVIAEVKNHAGTIDLIELNGDLFMLSNKNSVREFLSYMETLNIPYATVWGNHDLEGQYSTDWLGAQFMNAKNSLYTEVNDGEAVHGRSNYVINLEANGTCAWQLAMLDSGASYCESPFALKRTYDYIRSNQTDWFIQEHDAVGKQTPVIAYYHIPQWNIINAYNDVTNENASYKNAYFKFDSCAASTKSDSDFFDRMKDNGLKGCFFSHDHNNDWTVDYEGVTIGYTVKSTKELYYLHTDGSKAMGGIDFQDNFDLLGASLVTLHDNGKFDLDHLYYNIRDDQDFVKWVRY